MAAADPSGGSGFARLLDGLTAVSPSPDPSLVALTGAIAAVLVLLPATWRLVRLGITAVHEAGHAGVAVLVGRRLSGVRLHADTSGLTVSVGRSRGPGIVLVMLAGYLAPAVLGLIAVVIVLADRPRALLWGLVALCLALLLWVRNAYGVLVLVTIGAAVAAVGWWLPGTPTTVVAHLVAWLLLLGAPRPPLELLAAGRRRPRTSDADQLARLTGVPALVWVVLFVLAGAAGLVVGAVALVPDALHRLG